MKFSALKKKNHKELVEHANTTREKIAAKKQQYVMGEITDNKELKKLRIELARTLTLLNQPKETK